MSLSLDLSNDYHETRSKRQSLRILKIVRNKGDVEPSKEQCMINDTLLPQCSSFLFPTVTLGDVTMLFLVENL